MPDPVKPLKSRRLKNIVNPYGGGAGVVNTNNTATAAEKEA